MNRTKGILAAGTFTGLILITILALGFGRLQASSADNNAELPATAEIVPPSTDNADMEQALQEWQNYSHELEQTISALQARDVAYQQQLEAANATITSLQDEINNTNSVSRFEEHESNEHEAHEDGGFDE